MLLTRQGSEKYTGESEQNILFFAVTVVTMPVSLSFPLSHFKEISESFFLPVIHGISRPANTLMWDLIDVPGPACPDARANETWDTLGSAANEDAAFKIFDKEFDNLIDAPDSQFVWGTNGWKNRFAGRTEATAIDNILTRNGITNNC